MTEPLSRRALLIVGVSAAVTAACARIARPSSELAVYKSPTCGCCGAWVEHMTGAGFQVRTTEVADPGAVRLARGVPDSLAACHTAVIEGYVLEGHVPAEDVRRLLMERPDALGLAVPAMPLGSPGMEMPDGRREAYETLLILEGGGTRVFARHV
ncbi:DUF411 domain-containing protein [Brevundimonas sp.]|jgi:hypothetical protein|uniref:DUF411 domain-containing protein n=1 Tax=Brevundimonas sp. TaxID=1871086 RepID=UPI003A939B83